jgi:hypothetical protein
VFRSLQFSSEFPQQLNGIVTSEEFYQSIANINQAYRKTFCELLLLCIGPLCLLAGFILLLILSIKAIRDNAIIPVAVVGGVLAVLGSFSCICIQICIDYLRRTRVRNVLADESMKYSMRLMLPIKWRSERHYIPPTPGKEHGTIIENVSNII